MVRWIAHLFQGLLLESITRILKGNYLLNTSCNEYYLKNLISSGSNNYCRSRRESDAEYKLLMSPKRNLKSTDMNQVITKSNSKLNLPMYYKVN